MISLHFIRFYFVVSFCLSLSVYGQEPTLIIENGRVIIKGSNIGPHTVIASSGLGFLRAAHLQASGQGGKGHAH